MGLDIGYFGPIQYFERPPEKIREFFEELLADDHFTAAMG
jgi:hypothetical protein